MTQTAFDIESWIWYGVVMTMVILRFTARLMHFKSVWRLQIEDWLMLFITCLYTILIEFLNIDTVVQTNLINPADIPHLTPQDIRQRTWGSKTILLVEQCMCAVQWGTKVCLLILYWRITQNLTQNLVVKCVAAYVAATYVVMEILYFGVWCRPFHDYWKTPTNNTQCTTALHHLIVNLVFNLTSDLLIMSIPLPLLMKAHMDTKRKVLLVFPFTLGLFTIVCAILSKHLSFTQPFSGEWVYWYCRESSTAMIVTNMPYSWSLIRKFFKLKSFFGDSVDDEGRTLQGVSLREASQVSTMSKRGNRASRLLPERWKGGSRSQQSQSDRGRERHPSQGWLDAPLSLQGADRSGKQTNTDPLSSMSSGDSVIKVPPPAVTGVRKTSTADALDKLYRLDDLDDDVETETRMESRRGGV